jgi:hypothetical protein
MTLVKPKRGEYRRQLKARRRAERKAKNEAVRPVVFSRAHGFCECCKRRRAETMHEDRPKSLFGNRSDAISEDNSYAVCGSGTTGCHGYLQRHEIVVTTDRNGEKAFTARYPWAQRWIEGT